jgi:formylmethanofuran dehydrogenase subunit C
VNEVRLRLRDAPMLRVDLRGITPLALARLPEDGIARTTVWHGNEALALGELFAIERRQRGDGETALAFEGDLARFDRLGWQLDGGCVQVDGNIGHYVGAEMRAGHIRISGRAGTFAACEMRGGELRIDGDVGDFAAGSLPGSMDGMRGGTLLVGGNAGERCGDRMRRGIVLITGRVGDFVASRMVAGTIAVAGAIGAHPAFGMRRGTLVLASARPLLLPTFVSTSHDLSVIWRLLAASLARISAPYGPEFALLAQRHPLRYAGDLAVEGKGEVLCFD